MIDNDPVLVEKKDGIAWVTLNRPNKRNAMNPAINFRMVDVLEDIADDDSVQILVLTGAGESWCAGNDLQEYFREMDSEPARERERLAKAGATWRWYRLFTFPKPTIAMVNGYAFGGAFTQLIACDFAISDEDAIYGLSEVNWGIFPGGLVSRAVAEVLGMRDALYYIMTGDTFDGRKAEAMGLINRAVPKSELRGSVLELAQKLMSKNPATLRAAKEVYKTCRGMSFPEAEDYMRARATVLRATDPDHAYQKGITRFLDDKAYRPGFESYRSVGREPVAGS